MLGLTGILEVLAVGLIHVNVTLSHPTNPDAAEEVRVLVDTGATLSVIPAELLERLGIERYNQRRLRGFGGVIVRDVGTVNLRYGDTMAGVTVVFGEETDPAVMGVTALEVLGFQIDPVGGALQPAEMLV